MNKKQTIQSQFEKIVAKYLPERKDHTTLLFLDYKQQHKTKGVKAFIGYVHYEETKGDIKYIAGTLGHDLNGIGDIWKTPRSADYYKYYKSSAN